MFNTLDRRRGGAIVIRLAATISVLAGQLHAVHAQSPGQAQAPAAAVFSIQQPAQDLGDALLAIARQTGTSVLFDPAVVKGRRARPLSGQYTASEALQRAIEGSGLVLQLTGERAAVVRLPAEGADPASAPTSGTVASTPEEQARSTPPPEATRVAQMSRVEVTGSRLKRIDSEGPMPVHVYGREDIVRSGQPSLTKFLGTLNEVSMNAGEGTHSGTAGQGTVQLRGMPLGSTAVLLNGRKLQGVGSSFSSYFNLNLIPLGAIERIEVLPIGSSAIYGGDALAGVVNIVLKKSLEGFLLDLRLGGGRGFEDGMVSFATGRQGDEGSFILLGSYSKATPLSMSERDFFLDADYRRFGGPDARTTNCAPGTVSSPSSTPLPGVGATSAGIPSNAAGRVLAPSDFAATAGRPNVCSDAMNGNGNALVYRTETLGLHAAGDRRLGEAWTAFGELTLSEDRLDTAFAGMKLNNVLVPASNAYNPFGVPVRVTSSLGLDNGSTGVTRPTRYLRALGGVRGDLPAGWDLEATLSSSRDASEQHSLNASVNAAARTAALASSNPATALNLFTGGKAASDEVLRSIWSDLVRQSKGRKDVAAVLTRGPVVTLPAGSLDAALGAEFARDTYRSVAPGNAPLEGSRSARAAFLEVRAPLLRRGPGKGRGDELAAVTLAARTDHYSVFGSAATYQAGLEVRPASGWLVRASAATSFKPPTLDNALVPTTPLAAQLYGLVDPARNNEPISTGEVVRMANPSLEPERGKASLVGAQWEPRSGLRLGATAWRIRAERMIVLLQPQVILANEAQLPGTVVREPSTNGVPGRLVRLNFAESNLGHLETSGIDLEAQHSWKTSAGTWTLGASATRVTAYDVKLTPTSAVDSRLGKRYLDYWAPKWKGQVSTGFATAGWSLALTGRYVGSYTDVGASQRSMGRSMVYDLAGRFDLKRLGWPVAPAHSAVVSLGLVNITDRMPDFSSASPYFDQTQADWRGRTASLRLSMDW
ncbi:TonB-dependent receptor [Piscinibacter sakaiensis]|uniref:Secretin/TonB short N-terminal domain-containing protein n=1 Tax=Piscinibacter sakaiensis TaxID=1547922 RepID=A0A0K8P835_PISS1|nr:TonB-dependent receptor [Piscinibacter sakaiensis]GAP38654.1 hypothetical protein ISF6_5207 [Piscinibacter sakaiensis]